MKPRKLRSEWVISIAGAVTARGDRAWCNPKLATGEVEVAREDLEVLSQSPTPPFTPDERETVNEEKRLEYRYSTSAARRCRRRSARAIA